MSNPKTLMRVGAVGTVLVVLCCFTPILVILLGVVGLSAFTGYLDYVLLPALIVFIGLTIYAVRRKQQADACCAPTGTGEKNDRNQSGRHDLHVLRHTRQRGAGKGSLRNQSIGFLSREQGSGIG
jgi:mercuric ion transport protein